jgi:hypothetical protein
VQVADGTWKAAASWIDLGVRHWKVGRRENNRWNDVPRIAVASPPPLCVAIATFRWHHAGMNRPFPALKSTLLCLTGILLSSCAGQTAGERIADMPHWMGGEPAGVPPRRGTPEYDAWMAARAQEAAKPKTDQTKADQTQKTDRPK